MSSEEIRPDFYSHSNPLWEEESYINTDNIKTESGDCEEKANDNSSPDGNLDVKFENESTRTRKRIQNYLYLHMYGHDSIESVDSSDEEETLIPERIVKAKIPKKARSRSPSISVENQETLTHSLQSEKVNSFNPDDDSQTATGEEWEEEENGAELYEPEKEARPKRPYQPRAKTEEPKRKRDKSLCYICGKLLANQRSLNLHIRSHVGPAWLYCKVCSKKFPTMEDREIHFQASHDPNEKTIKCKYCEEYFATIYSRQKHVSKIHKELRFSCSFCAKKFVSKEKMECHVGSIHDGQKNYFCQVCGKSYSQKVTLNYHLRSHSDNKNPFKCGVCAVSYTYKYTMLNHVKSKHTDDGKAPVKCCEICLTGFLEDGFDNHDCKDN